MDTSMFTSLGSQLEGTLLLPNHAEYDEARSVWNGMIDRRPAAIARVANAADVQACVSAARAVDAAVAVKGGGHNIAGLAVCEGGLVIDMSAMRGVTVDPTLRLAQAQAGCLLGDVDRATQEHGLATVLGFVSNTGIAGLTLGGGFGYLTRQFGWTCDNVASMDVVTADGRLVRASNDENADLFWALRGGGGNFGVVTSFTYRLQPIGPTVLGGPIAWHAADASTVLAAYRMLCAEAPEGVCCAAVMRIAPPAPWIPSEAHGRPVVMLVVCCTNPMEEAMPWVERIRSCATPVADMIAPRPYVQQQTLLDATQPKGRRYYWKSEYLPGLDPDMTTAACRHAFAALSPHSGVILFPVDGSHNTLPEDHAAAGNRSARVVLNIAASWENADEDDMNIAWARDAWEDMRRFSTGGAYINFQTDDEADDRIHAAYGVNYDRLGRAKAAWDPENLFRANKNIPPRTS